MGRWKICCVVSAILVVVVVVVSVTLYFTLFKPKHPKIILQSVTIESVRLAFPDAKGNVTLGLTVMVDNPNYGGFKYDNSTAYINYGGNLVAEAPIGEDSISPRSKKTISTSVIIFADKLVTGRDFWSDFFIGAFNFTSSTTLHGKVNVFKIFKLKGSSSSYCNISVFLHNQTTDSVCTYKIKL
ncbi:hypothetical protein like AT3G54200 [Hibiscus trionum]|uniref:Late embryogenesis abundant protein LEA-2 subgroup domain-containing protein n=1 Tax=Hibiscus trionum TaxID=183268 RepID=A0A9W7M671_HIBTR|nr:hypothetical protein like AT3G54200 [Hibiscus trionum]